MQNLGLCLDKVLPSMKKMIGPLTYLWWAVLCELRRLLPKWDDPEDKIWFADVVFGKVKVVVDGGLVDDDLDVGGGILIS